MQPNTLNTHHNTDPPVPPELLETVARALAAVLIPPPRAPDPTDAEEPADFLTAAQLARRLGVSRETIRRLAIAGALPHTPWCAKAPARPPAGTRGGSPTSSRPAAWR
jgi:hypothetical protein